MTGALVWNFRAELRADTVKAPWVGVFVLAGLWLLYLAGKSWLQWRRFGTLPLTLDPYRVTVGGDLGGTIEITALRLAAIGAAARLKPATPPSLPTPKPIAHRPVWQDETTGWVETPVFARADLAPGHRFTGPLIVEEATTTVVVGPGDILAVDASGNFDITVGAA